MEQKQKTKHISENEHFFEHSLFLVIILMSALEKQPSCLGSWLNKWPFSEICFVFIFVPDLVGSCYRDKNVNLF